MTLEYIWGLYVCVTKTVLTPGNRLYKSLPFSWHIFQKGFALFSKAEGHSLAEVHPVGFIHKVEFIVTQFPA